MCTWRKKQRKRYRYLSNGIHHMNVCSYVHMHKIDQPIASPIGSQGICTTDKSPVIFQIMEKPSCKLQLKQSQHQMTHIKLHANQYDTPTR